MLPERRRAPRARRLFVIEVSVPGLQRLPPGETFQPFDVSPTHLGFDEYDVARQGLVSHHYWIVDGKVEVLPPPFRYVWPSELDLMARLAGMTLRERWSGWNREPFTSESTMHVSVWEDTWGKRVRIRERATTWWRGERVDLGRGEKRLEVRQVGQDPIPLAVGLAELA